MNNGKCQCVHNVCMVSARDIRIGIKKIVMSARLQCVCSCAFVHIQVEQDN